MVFSIIKAPESSVCECAAVAGLIDWIKAVLVEQEQTVGADDLKLIKIVDNEDEVVEVLDTFYKKYTLKPNF